MGAAVVIFVVFVCCVCENFRISQQKITCTPPIICSQEISDKVEINPKPTNPECPLEDSAFMLDNLFDVLLECEGDIKNQCLSEDSIQLLSIPENKRSRKIYARYQNFFKAYIVEDTNRGSDETILVNFFTWMDSNKRYSPGSFLCIFSCIRSMILVESRIDIKTFVLL